MSEFNGETKSEFELAAAMLTIMDGYDYPTILGAFVPALSTVFFEALNGETSDEKLSRASILLEKQNEVVLQLLKLKFKADGGQS